jgi:CubicO group peptidase (beta-lactamase class C family)
MAANPGKAFHYSTGLDWGARILEKVTKMSLGEYMQENIFKPLGMKNTTFHPDKHPSFPTMLEMTTRPGGPNTPLMACPCPYPIQPKEDAGGAGLFSTAEDYAKLVSSLLQDNNPILSKRALEELVSPQLTVESKLSLAVARSAGMILPEIPEDIPTDFSLNGLYMDSDVPDRRAKGTVCWDGMCSSNWVSLLRINVAYEMYVADIDTDSLLIDVLESQWCLSLRSWRSIQRVRRSGGQWRRKFTK